MKHRISWVVLLVLLVTTINAFAQDAPNTQGAPKHRFEITPYGGAVWTRGYEVLLGAQQGNLDTRESAIWGISVGYSLRDSLTQIEVLYNRQDTDLFFEFSGDESEVTGVSIEHLHVGGLLGVPRGRSVWFTTFSLGTSRWAPKSGDGDDAWRFSLMFGLGAKYPINERFGLRLQVRAPYMFVEDSANFICGPSGCLKSAGGRGIWQFDMSVGLIILL